MSELACKKRIMSSVYRFHAWYRLMRMIFSFYTAVLASFVYVLATVSVVSFFNNMMRTGGVVDWAGFLYRAFLNTEFFVEIAFSVFLTALIFKAAFMLLQVYRIYRKEGVRHGSLGFLFRS